MATQLQIDALTAAIASGTLEVRHGDKVIKYASTADLMAAKAALTRELDFAATPTAGSPRHQLADFRD